MKYGHRGINDESGMECNCVHNEHPALEHDLTCPVKAAFLLNIGVKNKDTLLDLFKSVGYGPSVAVPFPDISPEVSPEMMQCTCGHWFPRWKYYRCTACGKGH